MVTCIPLRLLKEISGIAALTNRVMVLQQKKASRFAVVMRMGLKGARGRILLDRHSCSAVYEMCYRSYGGDLRLRKSIVKFGRWDAWISASSMRL
jgi:hypothetical protein